MDRLQLQCQKLVPVQFAGQNQIFGLVNTPRRSMSRRVLNQYSLLSIINCIFPHTISLLQVTCNTITRRSDDSIESEASLRPICDLHG